MNHPTKDLLKDSVSDPKKLDDLLLLLNIINYDLFEIYRQLDNIATVFDGTRFHKDLPELISAVSIAKAKISGLHNSLYALKAAIDSFGLRLLRIAFNESDSELLGE